MDEKIECLKNMILWYEENKYCTREVYCCECGDYFETDLFEDLKTPFFITDAKQLIQLDIEENKK